jgi:hypothetical protein
MPSLSPEFRHRLLQLRNSLGNRPLEKVTREKKKPQSEMEKEGKLAQSLA